MHLSSIPNTRIWFVATVTVLALAISLALASKPASAQSTDTHNVVVSANNAATITLTLDAATVGFGDVNPDDTVSAESVPKTGGAFYIKNSAVGAQVNSNATWNGTVSAPDNSGTSTQASMPLSQLKWSKSNMTASADGTSFTNGADASAFGGITPVAAGEHTYDYAYGLDVNYLNKTGSFATTATYTVTQG